MSETDRSKAIQELMHYMNEPDFKTSIGAISNLQESERKKHSKELAVTIPEKVFRDIVANLAIVQGEFGEEDARSTLEGVHLYSKSAKELHQYLPNSKRFKISLSKGQMIHVDFSGLGSEHLGEHPAIVWDTQHTRDHVLVIPCTSYKLDTTVESEIAFDIGPARFFDTNGAITSHLAIRTVVLLDQIQPVSRKRIVRHKTIDPLTRKGGIAKFGQDQLSRIEAGLKVLFFAEKTFFEKELLDIKGVLPEFLTNPDQYLHMHRSDYKIISDDDINMKYEIDGNEFEMKRRQTSMLNKDRKRLLKGWNNPRAIKNKDGDIIKNTPSVRQDKYTLIQNAYLPDEFSTNAIK